MTDDPSEATTRLEVEFENHTGLMLAFEWQWHDVDRGTFMVPPDAHPRLVVTVTDMGQAPAALGEHIAGCNWCRPDRICPRCEGSGTYSDAAGHFVCPCSLADDGSLR